MAMIIDVMCDSFGNCARYTKTGGPHFSLSEKCRIPQNFSPAARSCQTGTDGYVHCQSYNTAATSLCQLERGYSNAIDDVYNFTLAIAGLKK